MFDSILNMKNKSTINEGIFYAGLCAKHAIYVVFVQSILWSVTRNILLLNQMTVSVRSPQMDSHLTQVKAKARGLQTTHIHTS